MGPGAGTKGKSWPGAERGLAEVWVRRVVRRREMVVYVDIGDIVVDRLEAEICWTGMRCEGECENDLSSSFDLSLGCIASRKYTQCTLFVEECRQGERSLR